MSAPDPGDVGRHYLATVRARFAGQKKQAEGALAQVDDAALFRSLDPESNSLSVLVRHIGGNLRSRFRDLLTTDGEKPDRHRDLEFEASELDRAGLLRVWEAGWAQLFESLDALTPDDLMKSVAIRGEPHTVVEALERSVVHVSGHVGQIVQLAKHFAGDRWRTLSIPRRRPEKPTG